MGLIHSREQAWRLVQLMKSGSFTDGETIRCHRAVKVKMEQEFRKLRLGEALNLKRLSKKNRDDVDSALFFSFIMGSLGNESRDSAWIKRLGIHDEPKKYPGIGEIWRKRGPIGWLKVVSVELPGHPDYDGGLPGVSVVQGDYKDTKNRVKWDEEHRFFYDVPNYTVFMKRMKKESYYLYEAIR